VLRTAIVAGRLPASSQLPSSRDLAGELGMSRNTVNRALNQLIIEGYLSSHVGRGTFVNELSSTRTSPQGRSKTAQASHISTRGQALITQFSASQLEIYPFTPGLVDFSNFPLSLWRRLQDKHWRLSYPDMLDYSYSGGYAPLRKAVADHLRLARGMSPETDQIIITSGTQQSLELCSQLLADLGEIVWVEDPAYWGALKAFMSKGLTIQPIKVDLEGIAPTAPDMNGPPPRLIYVTPSHQYPTGSVMSMARRAELLSIARGSHAWILEDDYDSEFHFHGVPQPPLAELDQDGRVLYMGSFSKVLYPGLKLGYLVVPRNLASAFKQGHYDLNRPGQIPLQAALAEFIEHGHFAKTLYLSRVAHAEKRATLMDSLQPCLKNGVTISGVNQGLHLCVNLPKIVNDVQIAQRLAQKHLTVRPLSAYCFNRKDLRGLVIGYGYAPLTEIKTHGPTLAREISQAILELKVS
jgi:GntR family transcriptional regulator/MocR family aminotransferase